MKQSGGTLYCTHNLDAT